MDDEGMVPVKYTELAEVLGWIILFVAVATLSGCATSQEPTLETLMRKSFWYGCAKKYDGEIEIQIWTNCKEKSEKFDLYDIPQYSEELRLIRVRPKENPR